MRAYRILLIAVFSFLLISNVGCFKPYPKWMDSDEFGAAAVDAFKQATKTYSAENDLTNPAIEFYMINGVGARATGVISRGHFEAEQKSPDSQQPGTPTPLHYQDGLLGDLLKKKAAATESK